MTEENRRLDDKFALRLPKSLKEEIAELAAQNSRSTNAEIVARLYASLEAKEAPVAGWELGELRADLEKLKVEVATLKLNADNFRKNGAGDKKNDD